MTVSILPKTSTDSDGSHGTRLAMSRASDTTEIPHDDVSDYGDFTLDEQEIIEALLANIAPHTTVVHEALELTDIEDYEEPRGVHLPKILGKELWTPPPWMRQQQQGQVTAQTRAEGETTRDIRTTNIDSAAEDKRAERERTISLELQAEPIQSDTRSPLERFRTKPKKALSVTDLISPAWCELQYFYTLSKHGKKRATPAMRQGTKVHKKLEDEIHTTVPVSIATKEDSWGLRIWNIIQGLRTLRETGRTRELEVWGVVDGEVVNGVIDELSYECPDPGFAEREAQQLAKGQEMERELPEDQLSITDYLLSPAGGNGRTFGQLGERIENSMGPPSQPLRKRQKQDDRKIYITDIKTRSVKSLPSALAARPTEIQLQLYHSMLTSLAQGKVPLSAFTQRYNFDPSVPLSDSFIAEVGSLNEQFFDAISSQSQTENSGFNHNNNDNAVPASSQDSIDILLKHNTVASLWNLMIDQFQQTFLLHPPPTVPSSSSASATVPDNNPLLSSPPSNTPSTDIHTAATRLSPLLTASYIRPAPAPAPAPAAPPSTHNNPDLTHTHLGIKTFMHSPAALSAYLSDEMAWWRGERKARGVDISQVNAKCTRCEFLAECEWVKARETELREGSRTVGHT